MNVRTNEKIITLGVVCNQCGHVIEDCILQAQNPHFCKIFLPSRGWGILCPHEGVPDPVALTIEQQYVTVVH